MSRQPTAAPLLADQLLALLSVEAIADLALVCHEADGLPLGAIGGDALAEFERTLAQLLRIDHRAGRIAVRSAALRRTLRAACVRQQQVNLPRTMVRTIRAAITAGRIEEALAEFGAGGGPFFAHVHGVEVAQRVVGAFPPTVREDHERLILADAINAMKSGDLATARQSIDRCHPGLPAGLHHLAAIADELSDELLCCRLVIAVAEEETIADDVLGLLFARLENIDPAAAMLRGMFYNVALDTFVRRGQWATAEESAAQARRHFVAARAYLSIFYIDLYGALIALMRGEMTAMQARLRDAASALRLAEAHDANDERLLAALIQIRRYELGDPRPLSDLLLIDMAQDAFSELWPSVAGPIIEYGARALVQNVTLAAALAFLERWRLQQWRSHRFGNALALARVEAFQFHNRWLRAGEALGTFGADAAAHAPEALRVTRDRDTLRVAIRMCRQKMEEAPDDPALLAAVEAMLANDRIVPRQRIALLVWQAMIDARGRNWSRFRTATLALVTLVERTGLIAVLIEQRRVLTALFNDREARRYLTATPATAAFLRTYRGQADPTVAASAALGLTRQETRILLLLAERLPNKVIARRLGLTLPTVRFHLRNVYRKLGSRNRSEAIAASITHGIIAEVQ